MFCTDFKMRQLRNIHQMVDPEIDLSEEHIAEVGKQEKRKEVVTLYFSGIEVTLLNNTTDILVLGFQQTLRITDNG